MASPGSPKISKVRSKVEHQEEGVAIDKRAGSEQAGSDPEQRGNGYVKCN